MSQKRGPRAARCHRSGSTLQSGFLVRSCRSSTNRDKLFSRALKPIRSLRQTSMTVGLAVIRLFINLSCSTAQVFLSSRKAGSVNEHSMISKSQIEAKLDACAQRLRAKSPARGDVCLTCSFQAEDVLLTKLALALDPKFRFSFSTPAITSRKL